MKFNFEYRLSLESEECSNLLVSNSFRTPFNKKFSSYIDWRHISEFSGNKDLNDRKKIIEWVQGKVGELKCYYFFEEFEKNKKDIVAFAQTSKAQEGSQLSVKINFTNWGGILLYAITFCTGLTAWITDLPFFSKFTLSVITVGILVTYYFYLRKKAKNLSMLIIKKVQSNIVEN